MVQFWTSRGFAYLSVNYSGSAGFGRAYRNRLRGQWGILDVADCQAATEAIVDAGLADPGKLAIAGGSAGGYTVLRALTSTTLFTAGVSMFGVADLASLQHSSHKFESHYNDLLLGCWPQAAQLYADRSPINHVDRLATPILIMQGLDDTIVSPDQAKTIATALRAKKLPLALILFEGEGHGWRQASTKRTAVAAEYSFYAQLFGFKPSDDIATLGIDNLPSK